MQVTIARSEGIDINDLARLLAHAYESHVTIGDGHNGVPVNWLLIEPLGDDRV